MSIGIGIEEKPMAKPKGRPKKPSGEGTPVRIDPVIASKARYLASQSGVPMSDLLSDWLRPIVEREFRKAARDLEGKG
jgi:hypothetical protein